MSNDVASWAPALKRARAAWPERWVGDSAFIAHLQSRLPAGLDVDELAVEDLYLACACALGVGAAAEAFARTILQEVDAHVASMGGGHDFADEVRQRVAERLLVAEPGATPRIAEYAGSAPLSAWVRVIAIRMALNLRRGKAARVELAGSSAGAARGDVELEVLRRRYGKALETALEEALAGLPARERTILRLRFSEGMEVERIATMFQVHRVTVTRWLGACRDHLIAETRRLVADRLGLAGQELDSLVAVLRSQLHVSVARLLRD